MENLNSQVTSQEVVFKDIVGYEGLYQVSNTGIVKSLDKAPSYKGHSYLKGRELKQEITKKSHTDYRRVTLSKNSKTERFLVHRLVADAFIPNIDNKPHVNHIDNNGSNNHYSNLEWVTHSENMLHAQKQGRLDKVIKKATEASIPASIERNDAVNSKYIGETIGLFTLLSFDRFYSKEGKTLGITFKVQCSACGDQTHIKRYMIKKRKRCSACLTPNIVDY